MSATHNSSLRGLSEDCEINHHVAMMATSSNRGRFVMVAIVITSILILIGYRNSQQDGWTNSRLRLAQIALECRIFELNPEDRMAIQERAKKCLDGDVERVNLAGKWAAKRRLRDEDMIKQRIHILEEIQVDRIYTMQIPFLNVHFDVNDLGLLSGITLNVLVAMLLFALSREHENLFLALWKVRDYQKIEYPEEDASIDSETPEKADCKAAAATAEGTKPDLKEIEKEIDRYGASKANLLYHCLAMGQTFCKPPTLARWNKRLMGNLLAKVLMFLPFAVQALFTLYDWDTREFGLLLNQGSTKIVLAVESLSLLTLLALCSGCVIYWHSMEKRWRTTFFRINPSIKADIAPPAWIYWVSILESSQRIRRTRRR